MRPIKIYNPCSHQDEICFIANRNNLMPRIYSERGGEPVVFVGNAHNRGRGILMAPKHCQ